MTVDCPACGLSVPDRRAADIETPVGPISLCKACHRYLTPTGGVVDG